MDLTWLDPDQPDDGALDGVVAMLAAANEVDLPGTPAFSRRDLVVDLTKGWDGDPWRTAVSRDKRGRVVGLLQICLPLWDNTHLGLVEVTVDPSARRQGIGRRLLEIGLDAVRAQGRSLALVQGYDTPEGNALAGSVGLERGIAERKRRQDLLSLDWTALDRLYAEAEAHSPGYEQVRLTGDVPDDLVDDVLTMTAAINDAPIDDLDVEDEVFTRERLRAFELGQRLRQRRVYRVMARHRGTGGLAGHTVVSVDADVPGYALQFDTSVLQAHRGHRLGLLLKIGMLRWLGEVEPQLRVLDTWNAASNDHMIAVNEQLGYRVVKEAVEWQKQL